MVYSNRFVAVVKSQGQILRENTDIVKLPFGSEYSLLLKNLSSQRANVKISIDGRDVLNGNSLVINPNDETELEGFLTGNNVKNRFKFIQKTKDIQEHRGDKIDDGLIRIEFAFEKVIEKTKTIIHEYHTIRHTNHEYYYPYPKPYYAGDFIYGSNSFKSNSDNINCCASLGSYHGDTQSSNSIINSERSLNNIPLPDEGITVEGSRTNQNFKTTWLGELEESQVIILRLVGISESGSTIIKPVTVKTKITCQTCGVISKSNANFCRKCGTSLNI